MKGRILKGTEIFFSGVVLAVGMSGTAAAEPMEELWEYTQSEEDGCIIYEFKEISLKLPGNWEGKYEIEMGEDGVGFFHRDSLEAGNQDGEEGCGALFWLNYSEDYTFTENTPVYYLIGSGSSGVYYITVPGDLHGYQKDEAILNEWMEMSGEVEEIRKEADSQNPGAPMLTKDGVNFREEARLEGKILEVIPPDTEVWVTGNFESGWAQVNYNGEAGYVKADYLEFPDDITACFEEDEEDTEGTEDADDETGADSGEETEGEDADGAVIQEEDSETDIPYQGADSAMLYDNHGSGVLVQQAEDGYWYDGNGVCYGYWKYIQDAGMTGAPITNENGETYYWTVQN